MGITFVPNETVQCNSSIQTMSTIAVVNHTMDADTSLLINRIPLGIRISLIVLNVIMCVFSLVFLLSSLIIFIASGKKFFSHDINILHFNNTLSLFLAIFSVTFIFLPLFLPQTCLTGSFFLHFLWTNVILSSLSIAIVMFYTIWIVSINRTANKLSIFLIPIGWAVSLIWAVSWTICRSSHPPPIECYFSSSSKLEMPLEALVPMIVILLVNIALLLASLFRIWLVLRKQSSQHGELKRLRKVAISGILLIPALGLPFLSFIAFRLYDAPEGTNKGEQNIIAFLVIILFNSPIGVIHFILITFQIRESIIRKYWCCCCRITPAKIAHSLHSLHLNIVRPRPKQKNHQTVYENSTAQQTPDAIPDSVPSNDSAVFFDDSTQSII